MTSIEASLLLENAITPQEQSEWIDLGCGSGTFTYALADLLGEGSRIHAVDKLQQHLNSRKTGTTIAFSKVDFEKQDLPYKNIAGVIIANSLHYIEDQLSLIIKIKTWLKKGGKIILIEYDTDESNAWVPYPITYDKALQMFKTAAFTTVTKIAEMNSSIRKESIFSCMAIS